MLLGIIDNIDEQRRTQSKIRDASTRQSEFVARVSHELRNPLHTIAGMAELLTGANLDPQQHQQAEVVLREANALASIVADLLDIGRIDAGNFAVGREAFSTRTLIDRSVRSARKAAAAKGLRLNAHVHDAVPITVMGDQRRVGQILDNLIGNAIKFTATGSVTVSTTPGPADHVVFVVEDTGPGISAEFLDELFEPFARANESTTGAGLGLAISLRLAHSLGGSLRVADTGPGGTRFTLSLPLGQAEADVAVRQRRPDPQNDPGRTSRILVVEDNPETQMIASAQLTRLGYEHDIVGDGYQALELSDTTSYGAILMDWHLPGMDGLETTRRFRQREQREGRDRTPIISVTARAMAADIEACRQAGADDFVAKPASISSIGEALDTWTGGSAGVNVDQPTSTDDELFAELIKELGDETIVISLGNTFLDELPGRIEAIVGSTGGDDDRTELIAHTLASTSAMFGAIELSAIARQVEETARGDQPVSQHHRDELQRVATATEFRLTKALEAMEGI